MTNYITNAYGFCFLLTLLTDESTDVDFSGNSTAFRDIDNSPGIKIHIDSHYISRDDDLSNSLTEEDTNETELRKQNKQMSKTGYNDELKARTSYHVQSSGDYDFNMHSKDRNTNDVFHETGVHNNEVEDSPTALRLTGLRKPLSVTGLNQGTSLLLMDIVVTLW